jgi:hypothetical protein
LTVLGDLPEFKLELIRPRTGEAESARRNTGCRSGRVGMRLVGCQPPQRFLALAWR